MSSPLFTKQCLAPGSFFPKEGWTGKSKVSGRGNTGGAKRAKVLIATNPNLPSGLILAWKQIGCISVAAYLQALTRAVAELKWQINKRNATTSGDLELLHAFGCAVQDRKRKKEKYSDAACRLLVSEGQDIDAAFLDPDEAEAW